MNLVSTDKSCGVYSVYTKNIEERRLRILENNMTYEYFKYRPNGRKSYYEKDVLKGHAEAYINLSNTPISIGDKLL